MVATSKVKIIMNKPGDDAQTVVPGAQNLSPQFMATQHQQEGWAAKWARALRGCINTLLDAKVNETVSAATNPQYVQSATLASQQQQANTTSNTSITLSTAEIDASKTKLVPGTVEAWQKWTLPKMAKIAPALAKHLGLDEETFFACLAADPRLAKEDAAAVASLSAMLDTESIHVINFKAGVLACDEAEEAAGVDLPATTLSAYRLWHAIGASEHCGVGAMRSARVKAFKEKAYFKREMAVESFVHGANSLRADIKLLPANERAGDNVELRMLIKKVEHLIEEEAKEYIKTIDKREAIGKPPKWSYDELAALLAIDVNTSYVNDPTFTANKAAVYPPPPPPSSKTWCVACGSREHNLKDAAGNYVCTAKCKDCRFSFCPGVRDGSVPGVPAETCVVCADVLPPNPQVKNAKGWPIPAHLYKQLEQKRGELDKENGGGKASLTAKSARVQTDEASDLAALCSIPTAGVTFF